MGANVGLELGVEVGLSITESLLGDAEGEITKFVGRKETGIGRLGLAVGTEVGSSATTDGVFVGPVFVDRGAELGTELGLSAVIVGTRFGDDRGLFVAVGI